MKGLSHCKTCFVSFKLFKNKTTRPTRQRDQQDNETNIYLPTLDQHKPAFKTATTHYQCNIFFAPIHIILPEVLLNVSNKIITIIIKQKMKLNN